MIRMAQTAFAALLAFAALVSPATAQIRAENGFGVLVMAHGGGETWNREVAAMLEPVGRDHPLELAFGMADPATLQEAVGRLEARGVSRIAVVRLFVSGDSFRERTEQILGLRPGAPPRPADTGHAGHGGDHGGHSMALWRITSNARFALSDEGLANAPEMGAVLVERVRALSREPARESVLVLAHGPGDDAENDRWIAEIGRRAEGVRSFAPFREVRVDTLREDWPEKRAASQARIRAFVEAASASGNRAIVIPYRVQGFGPYGRVLEGLTYEADRRGLIPSGEVEQWVRRQIDALRPALAAQQPAP